MKYYMAETGQIDNGPGDKPLTIVLGKKSVSEEDFNKHIDDFINDADIPNSAKIEGKQKL